MKLETIVPLIAGFLLGAFFGYFLALVPDCEPKTSINLPAGPKAAGADLTEKLGKVLIFQWGIAGAGQ